eukprot:14737612-Alexandrium_andersonii.AAC.1
MWAGGSQLPCLLSCLQRPCLPCCSTSTSVACSASTCLASGRTLRGRCGCTSSRSSARRASSHEMGWWPVGFIC